LPDSSQTSNRRERPQKPRIAYLLSRYPAISHTFFLKEVLGLRERGLEIETASINLPDRPVGVLPPVEAAEARQTFYVKPGGFLSAGLQVLACAWMNPAVTVRGALAAWRLGGWDLKSRAFAFFYLAEALLIGRWMRRRSLDHLHVHFGGAVATVGMLTAEAWQIPWSLTLHGPDEFFDQEAFYLRQKVQSAGFVVCISDFCKSQVLRIAPGLEESRLEVVRLGVDCVALQPAPALSDTAAAPQSSSLHLVCTGRMVAAKGHRVLLQALASLAALGVEFSCALIGDGPERSSLESLSARLAIGDRVRFLGAMAHTETLAEVARADVFVLASFAEGLPVALMEAMALGVPCVSTTIAAIPELICDGVNGSLVSPANPETLCNVLSKLAQDGELRRQLGRRARATVEADYNLASNLDRLAGTWMRRLPESRATDVK
jgi:colanic acid/amylovoran biosynthesis glycosyltransferase